MAPSGDTQIRAKGHSKRRAALYLRLHSTPVSHLVDWVQLQLHSLASKTSAGEISSKTLGNLLLEIMTNTTSARIPAHVYLWLACGHRSVLCLSFSLRFKSPLQQVHTHSKLPLELADELNKLLSWKHFLQPRFVWVSESSPISCFP